MNALELVTAYQQPAVVAATPSRWPGSWPRAVPLPGLGRLLDVGGGAGPIAVLAATAPPAPP